MQLMKFFHPSWWIAFVRRRRTCVLQPGARVFLEGRIINLQAADDAISIGAGSKIRGELFTFAHGGKIAIGSHCYVGPGTRIWSGTKIEIGDHVLIAHNVSIMDNLTHPMDPMARRAHFSGIVGKGHALSIDLEDRPVVIARDVWIGAHSVILRGVTVGEGAIVGAGSIVTKDVKPYSLVAGNPATKIRDLDRP